MRIAIVGSGVAGLVVASRLYQQHDIAVFEAQPRIGGHIHTVAVPVDGGSVAVDTGFIVYNERNYPFFTALLRELGVATQPTTMSFSVRSDLRKLEYNGSTLNQLYIQRWNLLSPGFHGMVRDILRFNRDAPLAVHDGSSPVTLAQYLRGGGFGDRFIADYLLPMGAALWSIPTSQVLEMPVQFFVRFFEQHGMLSVKDRPQWRVITGGSQKYQEALTQPFLGAVRLETPVTRVERFVDHVRVNGEGFDQVVIACHADEALRLLADPSERERQVLSAMPYHRSEVILHSDTSLLPTRRTAWGAWNFLAQADHVAPPVVTYNMNMLQSLPGPVTYCVSLNAGHLIQSERILARMQYHHPVHTLAATVAQSEWKSISGIARTHYCGAYWGYGFHEDGVRSALAVLNSFGRNA